MFAGSQDAEVFSWTELRGELHSKPGLLTERSMDAYCVNITIIIFIIIIATIISVISSLMLSSTVPIVCASIISYVSSLHSATQKQAVAVSNIASYTGTCPADSHVAVVVLWWSHVLQIRQRSCLYFSMDSNMSLGVVARTKSPMKV